MNKKKFAKAVLDKDIAAFVLYVTSLSLNLMTINMANEA